MTKKLGSWVDNHRKITISNYSSYFLSLQIRQSFQQTLLNINILGNSTLEQIFKLASEKAEAVEIYYLSTEDIPIKLENNCLKSLQTKAKKGVDLRLIYRGRLGLVSSTDLTRIEDLVDAAIQTAKITILCNFNLLPHIILSYQN